MITTEIEKILKKQHYFIVGEHSAVQICRWTKKSLRQEDVCYKEKFYGIKSHLCCQMSPWIGCENKCIHCWRSIEFSFNQFLDKNKTDRPKEIIDECILAQKKLLEGFKTDPKSKKKQLSKANAEKWKEAQEPMNFAISLLGESTLYNNIGEFIEELRGRKKTSFLVTNGLHPEKIKELNKKNQLPTQLYVSVNTPNKKMYKEFHRSSVKDAWERLNETLEILPVLKCRTVFRINLIKYLNMNDKCIKEFAEMIKKAQSTFVELKGYMSVGFARQRLGYERMPRHEDVTEFAKRLEKELENEKYKILDGHERSCAIVLGKDKRELKIKDV